MELLKSFGDRVAFHKQRSHRIEALADGVFAIVMTLLVLDIRTPMNGMDTEKGLLLSLWHTIPKIFTFILSFSLVGQFWVILTNQFNHIQESDRNSIVIVVFFLLFVSLLPFSTSFLGEHLGSRVAIGFYVFNILLIIIMGTLHWLYSWHTGLVKLAEDKGIVIHKAIMRLARTALICYGIVAISCFFSNSIALYATILLQILFTFIGFFEMINTALKKKLIIMHEANSKNKKSAAQSS
jgi:uncharacterized membrane protein